MDLFRRFICIAVVAITAPAVAAPKRSYQIDIAPATPELAWRAEAIAAALRTDLADDRLVPRDANPDLVVHGTVDATGLRYELEARWPNAPAPVRDAIGFVGIDRATFAGVLRDRMHRLARATAEEEPPPPVAMPPPGTIAALVAIAAALLALPFLWGAVRRKLPVRAAIRTAAGVAGFGGAAIALASLDAPGGIIYGAGGLAWGAFVAVTLPVALPPFVGLGRVDAEELPRVLVAWLGAAARRIVALAACYAAVFAIAWLVAAAFDLDDTLVVVVGLPVAGLVARQWLRAAVAVAARELDAVAVEPAHAVAWDAAVRAYLVGYFRRNGLPADDELLARVRFLPGKGDDVLLYGGGLDGSRVVIPRRLLEVALSPWGRPHDYAAPRISTLHWTQWNAGLVMATEPGSVVATREQRQPRETTTEGDTEREPIGEPPTLVGIVEPTALDPRTGYRPSEDPLWLDYDPGEDYDGTDAGDRDFLFGILVLALGDIQRHADRPATIVELIRRTRVRKLARVFAAPAAGDVHAAIAGARHHLVQYLAWLGWRRGELWTARAYVPELETASRRALALLDAPGGDPAIRRRLARVGAFARGITGGARPTRWRRVAIAAALVACAGGLALAVANAVRYHATYVERMENAHGKQD
jgi:hypothetical protein